MDRMKTFAKYIIWIILFWIFSDILIYAGLNSTYKDMENRGDTIPGIEVEQIQSTKVNGRIILKITDESLSEKYLKINLYSDAGNVLGTEYIEIGNVKESKNIEKYFKISDVKSYEIYIVDEMGESTEGFMDTALSTMTVLLLVIKVLIL